MRGRWTNFGCGNDIIFLYFKPPRLSSRRYREKSAPIGLGTRVQRGVHDVASHHGEHPAIVRKFAAGPTSRRPFPKLGPSTQMSLLADDVAK
jgi:hypothetical protein